VSDLRSAPRSASDPAVVDALERLLTADRANSKAASRLWPPVVRYVSAERARRDYGVVVVPAAAEPEGWRLDHDERACLMKEGPCP
jgi:hypothetical protein